MRLAALNIVLAIFTTAAHAQDRAEWALHEWGVLTVVPGDPFAHPDLVGEAESFPDFFIRADPLGQHPQSTLQRPGVARKPVIWIHGPMGLALDLRVTIPGGRPVIWHPYAESGTDFLRWQVWIPHRGPHIDETQVAPPHLPAEHWVCALRQASPSNLYVNVPSRPPEQGVPAIASIQAEQFLYYDAEVPAPGVVTAEFTANPPPSPGLYFDLVNTGAHPALDVMVIYRFGDELRLSAQPIPILQPGQRMQVDVGLQPVSLSSEKAIERRRLLAAELTATGLTAAEAEALLATWWEGFTGNQGVSVIHRMPQQQWERLLPIEANPAPASQVRVGLVHHVQGHPQPQRHMPAPLADGKP